MHNLREWSAWSLVANKAVTVEGRTPKATAALATAMTLGVPSLETMLTTP